MSLRRDDRVAMIAEVRRACATGAAKRIRTDNRLSIYDLGGAVGVLASTVSRWERGERLPRGDRAVAYGRLLTRLNGGAL